MNPNARPQCQRCRVRSSVFWHPITYGDRTFYLCDGCMVSLGEWIVSGRPGQ